MIKTLLLGLGLTVALTSKALAAGQDIPITITVGDTVLAARLQDNASSRELVSRFPLTVPMADLYQREMCYHLPESLPADEAGSSTYEIGDIAYWTPMRSLVIFYEQNGERISNLQKLGRIPAGVEFFKTSGDATVTFALADQP